MHLIGIDLGGTKIEGVALDADDPSRVVQRLRIPTEAQNGYVHILHRIKRVIELLEENGAELADVLGIGTPGTLDPETGLIRGSNTQCLNGRALKADLEELVGREFAMANDANCFALAEAVLGAGRGYETVFGIIMGTGCGGALVHNGRVLTGRHGNAGEWGQVVVEPDGERSVHGTKGIVEAYIAGPALEAFYEHRTGVRLPLREIVARTNSDEHARATVARLKEYFCRALAPVVDIFDPHAVVIGGGVGNVSELYSESVRNRLTELIFAPSFQTPLLKPMLGDSAGVFGAAMITSDSVALRSA